MSNTVKVVSDWLTLAADLCETILVSRPLWTQFDDVVVLAVVFFALLSYSIGFQVFGNLIVSVFLLSKPKGPIPKEDRNNAVYQLNCKDCKAVYLGETKRTLNMS